MLISIIIVNWNTKDLLFKGLDSIFGYPPSGDFEVIVVDNASSDGSVQMIKQSFPQVRVIENETNLGFACANNQALKIAQGRYLLLFNSDAELISGGMQGAIDYMEEQREVGACGVKLLNPDGSFQGSYSDFPTLRSEFLSATGLGARLVRSYYPSYPPECTKSSREVDYVAGAFILVRREVYERVGGLDESFWIYSEETDWCFRIKQAGWKISYLPYVAVIHEGGASSSQRRSEMAAELYRSKIQFFHKNYGENSAKQLRLMLWTIFSLREIGSKILLSVPRFNHSDRWNHEMTTSQLVKEVCRQPEFRKTN